MIKFRNPVTRLFRIPLLACSLWVQLTFGCQVAWHEGSSAETPWVIQYDPYTEEMTVATLPPFDWISGQDETACEIKQIALMDEHSNTELVFDTEKMTLEIPKKVLLTRVGKISVVWTDDTPACDLFVQMEPTDFTPTLGEVFPQNSARFLQDCATTTFVTDMLLPAYLISQINLTMLYTLFWLDDTVNKLAGGDSDNSICGTQSQDAQGKTWITESTDADGRLVLAIYTYSEFKVGNFYPVTISWQMTTYSSVRQSQTLIIWFAQLQDPRYDDYTMDPFDIATQTFSVAQFTLEPADKASDFTIVYTILQSTGAACPSFLTWTYASSTIDFTGAGFVITDSGQYNLKISATMTQPDGQSYDYESDTFRLTLSDFCLSTAFVEDKTVVDYVITQLGLTHVYTLFEFDDTINVTYGDGTDVSVCGDQTVTVQSKTWITKTTNSDGYVVLSFYSTNTFHVVSPYDVAISWKMKDYTSVTVAQNLVVYFARLEDPTTSDQSFDPFDSLTWTFSFDLFTLTPIAKASDFTIVYTVTLADGNALPSFLTWTQESSSIDFTGADLTFSDAGDYDILITATMTQPDGQSKAYNADAFTLTVEDFCDSTAFVEDQTLVNVITQLGLSYVYTLFKFDDTINVTYGDGSGVSVCGDQTLKRNQLDKVWIRDTTNSDGYMVLTFYSTYTAHVGNYDVVITWKMDDHTSITTSQTMVVYFARLIKPTTSSQSFDPALSSSTWIFSNDLFTLDPIELASDFTIVYTVTLADGSALPSFLTWTQESSSIDFTGSDLAFLDAGDYSILITATMTQPDGQSLAYNANAFTLTVEDFCDSTVFVEDQTLVNVITQLGLPYVYTLFKFDDTINVTYGDGSGVSVCGDQTLTRNQHDKYWVTDTTNSDGYMVLTFYSTYTFHVGNYNVVITWKMDDYTSITTTQTVVVYFATLLDPTTSSQSFDPVESSSTWIFSNDLFTLDPIEMASDFTIVYTVTLADGSALPSFLTWTQESSSIDFTGSGLAYSDTGDYSILITATMTQPDGQSLAYNANAFTLTVEDMCLDTLFIEDQVVSTQIVTLLGVPITETLFIVDDTANLGYGTDPLNSICGGQTTTVTSKSWITESIDSDGNTVLTFLSSSNFQVGSFYTIDVDWELDDYSSVKQSQEIKVYFCELVPPTAADITFDPSVASSSWVFSVDLFTVNDPAVTSEFDITYTVTLADGSAIPSLLTWAESASSLDFVGSDVKFEDAGDYDILITARATMSDGQYAEWTTDFVLTVLDLCLATALVEDQTILSERAYLLGTTVTETLFTLDDTTNQIYGTDSANSVCGTQTLSLSTEYFGISQATVGDDEVLTFYTVDTSRVGSHDFYVYWTLDDYSGITTSQYQQVYICKLVAPTAYDKTMTLFVDPSLAWSVNLFTVNPSSQTAEFTITYAVTLSDGSALPSFLTWSEEASSLDFTSAPTYYLEAGTQDVMITATGTQSNSQTADWTVEFQVKVIDTCASLSFVVSQYIASQVTLFVGNSYTETLFIHEDSVNQLYGSDPSTSVCGDQTITVTSESFIAYTDDSDGGYLTILTSDRANLGDHSIQVTWTMDGYPSVTEVQPMTLTFVELVEPATDPEDQLFTLYIDTDGAAFSVDLFTISPVAESSDFTITYEVLLSNGSDLPSFLTWSESSSSLDFIISGAEYSDEGGHIVSISATATLISDPTSTYTLATDDFTVTIIDPCHDTLFLADSVEDIVLEIDESGSITLPILTDTINDLYGTDSINSVCGTQTIVIGVGNVQPPSYFNTTTNLDLSVLLAILSEDDEDIGKHLVRLRYELDRYPIIKETIKFYIEFTASTALGDEYTINLPPGFVTTTQSSSSSQSGSSTSDDSGSGSSRAIPSRFSVYAGQGWNYDLPEVEDPEDDAYTVTVDMGVAVVFMSFENGVFLIDSGAVDDTWAGNYTVYIIVTDAEGRKSTTPFEIEIKANGDDSPDSEDESWGLGTSAAGADGSEASGNWTLTDYYNDAAICMSKLQGSHKTNWTQSGEDWIYFSRNDENLDAPEWIWSWSENLQSARQNKNFSHTEQPTVQITEITSLGEVTLTFSHDMIQLPVEALENALFLINKVNSTVDETTVLPGYYSQPSNLTFTYSITDYTSRHLKLQLYFDYPLNVTQYLDDEDWLQVKFIGNCLFLTEEGFFLPRNYTTKIMLPPQIEQGSDCEWFHNNGADIVTAAQMILGGNFILTLLMSASLNQMWSLINTEQIIMMLAFFKQMIPASDYSCFRQMIRVTNFDIFPTESFIKETLGWESNEPIDYRFDNAGIESTILVNTTGPFLWAIVLIPILLLLFVILQCPCCKVCSSCCFGGAGKVRDYLRQVMFWSYPLVTLMETYLILTLCVILNLKHFDTKGGVDSLSNIMSITFVPFIIFAPLSIGLFFIINWNHLEKDSFKKRFKALYENLNVKLGCWVIIEPMTFLMRRLILVLFVVFCEILFLQYYAMIFLIFWQVLLVAYTNPYVSRFLQYQTLANECFIMLITYLFMGMSDMVQSPQVRHDVGQFVCVLVFMHLFGNLALITYFTGKTCHLRCRRTCLQRKKALIVASIAAKKEIKLMLTAPPTKPPLEEIKEEIEESEEVSTEKIEEQRPEEMEKTGDNFLIVAPEVVATPRTNLENGVVKIFQDDIRSIWDNPTVNLSVTMAPLVVPVVPGPNEPIEKLKLVARRKVNAPQQQEYLKLEDADLNMIDSAFKGSIWPSEPDTTSVVTTKTVTQKVVEAPPKVQKPWSVLDMQKEMDSLIKEVSVDPVKKSPLNIQSSSVPISSSEPVDLNSSSRILIQKPGGFAGAKSKNK